MPQRVFITGGSGFVGGAIIDELLDRHPVVHALVNRNPLDYGTRVDSFPGGLFSDTALDAAMKGCTAVIHTVGIIMEKRRRGVTFERIHTEGTRAVVEAARRNGIQRFIHMSALGARPDAPARYHRTKFAAEEIVRKSGLDFTIFRPSLIHGPRGEFMRMEAMWSRYRAPFPVMFMPFMPYFGAGLLGFGGAGMLQPVHVKDVARAFVDALENPKTLGETYPMGGPTGVTWPELHKTVSRAVIGRERMVLPIPVWAAKLYCAIGIAGFLGFNRDQVAMSQEDNTTDLGKFIADFKWTPASFQATLAEYARSL